MKRTIDTGLDKAVARAAIDHAMAAYMTRFAKYHPSFEWKGEDEGVFVFRAKGLSLRGRIAIHDQKIDVDMDVPVVFRVFQHRAMKVIGEEVRGWVDKAKRGELL